MLGGTIHSDGSMMLYRPIIIRHRSGGWQGAIDSSSISFLAAWDDVRRHDSGGTSPVCANELTSVPVVYYYYSLSTKDWHSGCTMVVIIITLLFLLPTSNSSRMGRNRLVAKWFDWVCETGQSIKNWSKKYSTRSQREHWWQSKACWERLKKWKSRSSISCHFTFRNICPVNRLEAVSLSLYQFKDMSHFPLWLERVALNILLKYILPFDVFLSLLLFLIHLESGMDRKYKDTYSRVVQLIDSW